LPRFFITAEVRREVLDSVSLAVDADSLDEAFGEADKVLQDYPDKSAGSYVPYCYINNRMYLSNEIVSLEEDKYYG